MNFVKRRTRSSKVDIPEGARKQTEYIFLHEIVSLIKEFHIPNSLTLNLEQTPMKYYLSQMKQWPKKEATT